MTSTTLNGISGVNVASSIVGRVSPDDTESVWIDQSALRISLMKNLAQRKNAQYMEVIIIY